MGFILDENGENVILCPAMIASCVNYLFYPSRFSCGVLFGVVIVPALVSIPVYLPAPTDELLPSYGCLYIKKRSITVSIGAIADH
eukprot:9714618-Ditylum_brightwellii.AAC.1